MTDRYISSSATNGYGAGIASGIADTKANAWTLTFALSTAVAGDRFIFNTGDYRHASSGWVLNNSVTFIKDPALPGSVRLLAASGAAATVPPVSLNNASGKSYTIGTDGADHIGDFIIDGEGTLNDGLVGATTAGLYSLTAYGVQIINTLVRGWRIRSPDINWITKNCKGVGVNSQGGFYADSLASGSIFMENPEYGASALTGGFGGIFLMSPSGLFTGSCRILNPRGSVDCSGTSAAAIMVRSMPAYVKGDCKGINLITGSGSANAIFWARPVANVALDRRVIFEKLLGRNDQALAGYLLIIGSDATNATTNNTVNFAKVRKCELWGAGGTAATHGIMLGWQKGGSATGNVVRRAAIGLLVKGQTSGDATELSGNTIIDPNNGASGGCIYSKGSSNVSAISNNVIMSAGRPQLALLNAADDAGGISSNNVFIGNNIYSPDVVSALVTNGGASDASTALFDGNNYFVGGVSGTPWKDGANSYATLSAWMAAKEPSAESVTPTLRNPSFHHESYRALAAQVLELTNPGLPSTLDL